MSPTGFAKWGLSKATIAARIITDTIVGRSNRWAAFYDTRRLAPHASASSFVAENARVARRFVGDRLRPSFSRVPPQRAWSVSRGAGNSP
jgi:hypothetical protein